MEKLTTLQLAEPDRVLLRGLLIPNLSQTMAELQQPLNPKDQSVKLRKALHLVSMLERLEEQ